MDKNSTKPNKLFQRFSQSSVTFKFLATLGIIMILIAVVQILYTAKSTRQQIEGEVQGKLFGYFQVYESHVEAETNAAAALALNIASRSDIQQMYLSGDREGLYQMLLPLYESMKNHQIQHLYIHNPDGTVFLRVHNPERFGDDATYRLTLLDSLQGLVEAAGVEIGPNRMGIRGVAPMTSNGKFLGLIEVGIDFDTLLISNLKELTGADYTMWISYEASIEAGLKPEEDIPAAPIDEIFYYASTTENRLPISSKTYRSVLETGKPSFQVFTNNKLTPSAVYITPLTGYKGKNLGVMEISIPYTQVLQEQTKSTTTIALVTAGLTLIGLFLIALINIRVVIRPLQALSSFTQLQLTGDFNARVSLRTGDEFEQLANSFNNLADTVQEERRMMEQRVAERTKELEDIQATVSKRAVELQAVADISTKASQTANEQEMLQTVVEETKKSYNLYHTHIYLLDETGTQLELAAGAGEVGRKMVGEKRKIALNHPHSLVARAARTIEGAISNDISKEPDFLPNPLLPNTKAEMAIPIAVGERLLGILDVQADYVNRFTDEDIAIKTTLAHQVAASLESIRQFETSQKVARELGVVANISTATAAVSDASTLLQEVVDITKEAFDLYHVHIYLLEEDENVLKLASGAGEVGKQMVSEGRQIPLDSEKSLVARAARTRAGVTVNDVRADPDFLPNPLLPETRSEMAVPMIVGDRVTGVLDVQSEHLGRFTEIDINIKTTLAAQIAVALQNARSFAQARTQAEQEALLNTITQRIQGTTTVEAALQMTARELGLILGKRQTYVALDMPSLNKNGKTDASE